MQTLTPIAAFDVDAAGRATPAPDDAPQPASGKVWRWIHVDLGDPALKAWCAQHLDTVTAASLQQSETRPRADLHDDGIILHLRGVNLNPGEVSEDMVSLRLWVTETFILSARVRRVFAADVLRLQGEKGKLPASAAGFLARLLGALTDRIEDVSVAFEDEVDGLEERAFSGEASDAETFSEQRLKVIRLRRYILPQREATARLAAFDLPFLPPYDTAHLRESANRTARSVEELDAIRERLTALKDHLEGQRAAKLARNSNVLSIVAAIFLPLGFLTGLFGMNVGGLPGTDVAGAFAIVTLLMALIGLGLTAFFKWRKWF